MFICKSTYVSYTAVIWFFCFFFIVLDFCVHTLQQYYSGTFSTLISTTILPIALVNVYHAGEYFTLRVLLDGGAEKSFISTRLGQKLRLSIDHGRCERQLQSRNSSFIITPSLYQIFLICCVRIKIQKLENTRKLMLTDIYFYKSGTIDMIIGSDVLPFINCEGMQTFEGCLEARVSHFGCYISGPTSSESVRLYLPLTPKFEQRFFNLRQSPLACFVRRS